MFWSKRSPRSSSSPAVEPSDRETNPVATAKFMGVTHSPVAAAGAFEGPAFQRECDEFFASFCHRPGEKLIQYIEANQDDRLRSWLDWQCPEPEPKAFIRLMLTMIRSGGAIWDQPGVTFYFQGRWSQGGGPGQQSQECLSVIAQLIGKPISVVYDTTPERSPESRRVLRFQP
jgi:hypothetical protein